MTDHVVCIGLIWAFLDPTEVVRDFQAQDKSLLTSCEFSKSEKQFIIRCQPSKYEEVIKTFLKTLRDYTNRATLNTATTVEDPFEPPQATRLPETRVQQVQSYFDWANILDEYEQLRTQGPTSEKLINHETFHTKWKPDVAENTARSLFPAMVLENIGRETSCRIEWRHEALEILGDDQHRVDLAYGVLKNIEMLHLDKTRQRLHFDFYCDEAKTGYKFRFVIPRTIVDQSLLAKETLSASFYEVAMVEWDCSSLQFKQVARNRSAVQNLGDRYNPWAELVLFVHGDERDNPIHWFNHENTPNLNFQGNLPMKEIKRVSQWAQEVDEKPSDPFSTLSTDVRESGEEAREYVRTQLKFPDLHHTPRSISIDRSMLPAITTEPHILPGTSSNRIEPGRPTYNLHNSPQRHSDEQIQSIFRDSQLGLAHNDTYPPNDHLEEDDEETARYYRSHYSLRSGRGSGREGPVDLLSKVQKATSRIIEVLKSQRKAGVNFELLLGKLFIDAKTVPFDYRCHRNKPALAFAPIEWSSVLPTLHGTGSASSKFSSKMTRSWEDARFLLDLNHPTKERMFQANHQPMKTYYEIDCLDTRTGSELIIEFSADKTVLMRVPQSIVGAINIHFPRRVWDAKLLVSTTQTLEGHSTRPFVSIVDKLWIRVPDGSTDGAPERLYSKKEGPHILIRSVKLKREAIHRVRETEEDVHLHLTQVKQLQITDYPEGNFCAWCLPEEDMISRDLLWWEAKFSPTTVKELLDGECNNDNSPIQVAVRRLIETAQLVVTKIDSIGHSSQMPIDSNSTIYS